MKTKAQVLKENPQYKSLINAVIKQLGGTKYIKDINSHGIDGGFGGFIYYSDTHEFAMKNRKQIVLMLENFSEDFGQDIVSLVCSFRCVNGDSEDKRDIYKYVGGGKVEQGTITNAMAWFAAEEVCRMFDN